MILIKPAGFVGFLYHVFVGRESLDVRYYFLSKAWRDRRRLTSYHLYLSSKAFEENRREKSPAFIVGSAVSGAEIHFNIIL